MWGTPKGVGGAVGGRGVVIPDGPGASKEVWRYVPVMGDGRRCEYLQYSMNNTETGQLPTESNMAESLWSIMCIHTTNHCSILRIFIQQTLH